MYLFNFINYIVTLYLPYLHTPIYLPPVGISGGKVGALGSRKIETQLFLHVSDKQDSNLHHRPPRERTSPFGHYLYYTPLLNIT